MKREAARTVTGRWWRINGFGGAGILGQHFSVVPVQYAAEGCGAGSSYGQPCAIG
jgi:hypothetical protein